MKDIASSEKAIILEYLQQHEYATANDKGLAELLGNCSKRKVLRLLNYLADNDGVLHKETAARPYKYRLKNKDFIVDTLTQKEAIDLQYALEFSSEGFSQDSIKLIKRIFESNSEVVDGHLTSFEDLKDANLSNKYNELLEVIKHRYYTKLIFKPATVYDEAKCIKMLFIDNNWYVAFEYFDRKYKKKKFKLGRLSFLQSIEFLKENRYSGKNRFQQKEVERYLDFIANMQNAFTLYGVAPKTVTIKALPEVSQYFKEGMKKFFKSQRFIEELKDGSVVFSLQYTQPLEILPFIQKWMPSLIVEEGEIHNLLKDNLLTMLKKL
jgi:hypothetical protein